MGKRLFLIIIASLIAVINTPTILTAADHVTITGVSDAGVVETMSEVVEGVEAVEAPAVASTAVAATPVTHAPAAGYNTAPVNYTVTTYVSKAEFKATYDNLSYGAIYKYKNMVYGHNSAALLGNLASRSVGEVITITEGGVAKSYQVMANVVLKVADLEANESKELRKIANGNGYSLAMMTCVGDGSVERRVVYLNAV